MPAMIHIRNVPDALHRKLKARATLVGKSLSDYLLENITAFADKPSLDEWRARLQSRDPMNLGGETVAVLRAEREAR